jgi:DNA-binding response OmpR family regulator
VKKRFDILIADRNPHVRRFIAREMAAAGYRVQEAESGADVLRQIYRNEVIDLLILDPDLPDVDSAVLLKRLRNRIPFLPVVIHAFASDRDDHPDYLKMEAFVEKRGASIEPLKEMARNMLGRPQIGPIGQTTRADMDRT